MKNKKILLLSLVMFSFFAVSAQSKKSKKYKKGINKEAVANARFIKKERAKKLLRDSLVIGLRKDDSTRLALDSIADYQKDSARIAYRDSGYKSIDSAKNAEYLAMNKERYQWDKTEKYHTDIAHLAKLNDSKSRQVKYINQSYAEKAKVITKDSDLQSKAQELSKLNEERRKQLKALVGKHKEKVLERERKQFIKKYGVDADMVWIDIAETIAKK
jgi:hypothetical protein